MTRAAKKRTYDGRLRALQAGQRRDSIVDTGLRLFMEQPYEDVTLQRIADAAGVALKTVVRQFGTKDALFMECVRRRGEHEQESRQIDVGDVAGAARVLAHRYEEIGDMTMRFLALEDRFESVKEMLAFARKLHLDWLARVFAPWLPARERRRRLAQLFAATEIFVWWVWRNRLGVDRKTAEEAMERTLAALVASWE
jgi:AcrR family transcriptional regulator